MIPKTARTRLTLTYLAIIMALSIAFSVVFYMQSTREVSFGLRRHQTQLRDYLYFTTPEGVERIRNVQLAEFKRNLVRKLTALNMGMLAVGGVLSYILARRSLRPLEETLESQSRFTSDAAHELRTPLTAMKAEIEVALRDKKLQTAEAKAVLKSNLEEVGKLESLTAGLLRLARGDQGIDTSHFDYYKLSDILSSAHARLAEKAKARHITIKLPKTALVVYGDCDQLVELFVPLLGNAIKYSHEKSDVTVKATRHDTRVRVDVIDQGIGITEVDLPHIFERFYRADLSRNKTRADGYGLGLSLAEAITKAHGGRIRVKSEFGKGSTFTVELPSR